MKRKNRLQTIKLIVTILFLSVGVSSRGQCNFLSLDERSVSVLTGAQVVLGHDDPEAGKSVCYKWEGKYLEGDKHQSTCLFTAPNISGTYTVKVTRITEYVCTETITVTVTSDVYIEEVITYRPCWNHGDDISKDDFIIKTLPPKMERFVKISDNKAINNEEGITDFCVQFYTDVPGIPEHHKGYCDIKIVNSNISQGVTISSEAQKIIGVLNGKAKKFDEVLDCINDFKSTAQKITPGILSGFEPEFNLEFGAEYAKYFCCSKLGQGFTLTSKGVFSCSGEIRLPVNRLYFLYPPLMAVPPVVVIVGGASFEVSLSHSIDVSTCFMEQFERTLCVDLTFSCSGNAGVGLGLNGSFVTATVGFFLRGSGTLTLCAYTFPKGGGIRGDFGFYVEAELKSFVKVNYEYIIKSFGS